MKETINRFIATLYSCCERVKEQLEEQQEGHFIYFYLLFACE